MILERVTTGESGGKAALKAAAVALIQVGVLALATWKWCEILQTFLSSLR